MVETLGRIDDLSEKVVSRLCVEGFSHVQFCYPVDWSPPGCYVHEILQARMLQWMAGPSSRGSAQPRDWTHLSNISCLGRRGLHHRCHLGSVKVHTLKKIKGLDHFGLLVIRMGICFCLLKNFILGTSLVFQWLRLCVPSAGGLGWTLVRELDHNQGRRSHELQLRPGTAR